LARISQACWPINGICGEITPRQVATGPPSPGAGIPIFEFKRLSDATQL
jgi:hypothetical protein